MLDFDTAGGGSGPPPRAPGCATLIRTFWYELIPAPRRGREQGA